jgi:hypothetical protein
MRRMSGARQKKAPAAGVVSGEPNITPIFSRSWFGHTRRLLG